MEAASSDVIVNVLDANDNSPVFTSHEYSYTIQEDLSPGSLIAKIKATDRDSDEFGRIEYTLRGFGTDKFNTDLHNGNLYLIGSECTLTSPRQSSFTDKNKLCSTLILHGTNSS